MNSCDGGRIAAAVIVPLIITNPIAIFLTWYFTKKYFAPMPLPVDKSGNDNPIYDVPPDASEGISNSQFRNDDVSDFDSDSYDHVEVDQTADLNKTNGKHSTADLAAMGAVAKGKEYTVTAQPSVDSTYEKYIPDRINDVPSPGKPDNGEITVTINDDDIEDGIYEEFGENSYDGSNKRKPTLKPKPQRYKDIQ